MIRRENNKPEVSMEDMVNELSLVHPRYSKQLRALFDAYEMPFTRFCEKEAEYRLQEYGDVDVTADAYQEMKEKIAEDLFDSEAFVDGDVASQIAEDIIIENALIIRDMEDIKYFTDDRNPLINLEESEKGMVARILCNIHAQDSLQFYDFLLTELGRTPLVMSRKKLEEFYSNCYAHHCKEFQEFEDTCLQCLRGLCDCAPTLEKAPSCCCKENSSFSYISENVNLSTTLDEVVLLRLRKENAKPTEYLSMLLEDGDEIWMYQTKGSKKMHYFINAHNPELDCIADTLLRLIRFGLREDEIQKIVGVTYKAEDNKIIYHFPDEVSLMIKIPEEWVQLDDYRWSIKTGDSTYLIMEIRRKAEEFYICTLNINLNLHQKHFTECQISKSEQMRILAECIFERTEIQQMKTYGPYTELEVVESEAQKIMKELI